MPFLYVIFSERLGYYYKGVTDDITRRLNDHNTGRNQSTAGKGPWKLVFLRTYSSSSLALREEKRLKRTNTHYLLWYISQPFNELNK